MASASQPRRSYVSYVPDLATTKFEANQSNLRSRRDSKGGPEEAERTLVRRPYSSIQLKDETFAVLSVLGLDNKAIPLASPLGKAGTDTTSFGVLDYTDFILQQVVDQRAEKQQIVETFGDYYVFFYGEQPRIVTITGTLINTQDFNWRSQFWYNYDNYFRGSKLVQLNARAYLAWDTIVIEGYCMGASASEDATNTADIKFNMSILLTNYYDYSDVLHVSSTTSKSGQINVGSLVQEYVSLTEKESDKDFSYSSSSQRSVEEWLVELRSRGTTSIATQQDYVDYVNNLLKNKEFLATVGYVGYTPEGLPSRQVQDSSKIQAAIAKNNLLLKSNVRWQVNRALGGMRDVINKGSAYIPVQQFYAGVHNVFSQAGGVVDDLAKQASIATRAFGMFASRTYPPVANVTTFLADPVRMIKAMIGSSLPTTTEAKDAPLASVQFQKNRLSSAVEPGAEATKRSVSGSPGGYLGSVAMSSFSLRSREIQERIENGESVVMELGQAFSSYPYSTQGDTPAYEDVYGDKDYTQAISESPVIEQSLKEAYGDVDSSVPEEKAVYEQEIDPYQIASSINSVGQKSSIDVEPSSLEEVYNTGVNSKFRRTAAEILAALRESQSSTRTVRDEDTLGIHGIDDLVIEPVI